MTEGWSLGAPEYAALYVIFTLMLVTLNAVWVASLVESKRTLAEKELREFVALTTKVRQMDQLTMEDAARYRVLFFKYESWLGVHDITKPHQFRYRAARCAELLSLHGYVKGRLMIRRKATE